MSILEEMTIRIEWRTRDGRSETRALVPREFFDVDADTEAARSLQELVWTHNHAIDYLGGLAEIVETSLEVTCARTGEQICDLERFWNDGKCRLLFRRETLHGREVEWSRIVEVHTSDGIHFMRFGSASVEASELIEHTLVTPSEEVHTLFFGRS
ncbi:hypothetical protein [Nannocystis punicea]|uniref:Uncharacterized protein n=1 Tax=Nannocystis punicea TaxID=2995304 RepID=A0ABY7H1S1_9BACT|nr:hypothetical protein [Nannocystis poenicansa]WAS93138.1 hypothetical protein O0S08_43805 [Nannocystis poenicansa]